MVVLLPFLAGAYALVSLTRGLPSSVDLALLLAMYLATTFGVEAGFHRFIAHRAFDARSPLRVALVVLGSMAAQGPVLFWVAAHREHHAFTDQAGDPHSPRLHGEGFWGSLRGLWHAHVGWLFVSRPSSWARFAPDLLKDRRLFRLNQWYPLWVLLGLILPAAAGGLLTGSWQGFWSGMLWGGLVRIFLVQQATWSVNSLCHRFGSHPFDGTGTSMNNAWLALISLGGSWHNNHHAFPRTAVNRFEWWQFDFCGAVIRAFERVNWASNINFPAPEVRASRSNDWSMESIPRTDIKGEIHGSDA